MCALTMPDIRLLHREICFENARISNCKFLYFLRGQTVRRSPEGPHSFQKTGLI